MDFKLNLSIPLLMKLDEKTKNFLLRRELELRRLIRQMELDKLNSSKVFKTLEDELGVIKRQLVDE
ncbi:MAG: hypothetical protein ABI477_21390 [Chryseolinea sp.]